MTVSPIEALHLLTKSGTAGQRCSLAIKVRGWMSKAVGKIDQSNGAVPCALR